MLKTEVGDSVRHSGQNTKTIYWSRPTSAINTTSQCWITRRMSAESKLCCWWSQGV